MTKLGILLLSILSSFVSKSENEYQRIMSENTVVVLRGTDEAEVEIAVEQISKLAIETKSKWEPYYYAAFGYISLAKMQENAKEKDAKLDAAREHIELAQAIAQDHSEILALEGYLLIARLQVDPGSRGMHYSQEIFDTLYKAIRMDKENPRAHLLLGKMQIGMGRFMGTGVGQACESIAAANHLFQNATSSRNDFAPGWGKEEAEAVAKGVCKS